MLVEWLGSGIYSLKGSIWRHQRVGFLEEKRIYLRSFEEALEVPEVSTVLNGENDIRMTLEKLHLPLKNSIGKLNKYQADTLCALAEHWGINYHIQPYLEEKFFWQKQEVTYTFSAQLFDWTDSKYW